MSTISLFSKRLRWVMGTVVVLVIGAFLTYIASPLARNRVPSEFNESRQLAASVAQNIVGMLSETSANLSKIQELEQQQKGYRALDIVAGEIEKNKNISDQASQLALHLEIMAKQIPGISPDYAAQTALVAISSETALINQLLVYNNNLNNLLLLLRDRYMHGGVSLEQINSVVDEINQRMESINSLNTQFVQLMESFDTYYRE